MKTLCVLGRQPAISRAELESLYGAAAITNLNQDVVLVSTHPEPAMQARLGGTQKIASLLTRTPAKPWDELEQFLKKTLPAQLQGLPAKKIHLGVSLYGIHASLKRLQKTTFALKRELKQHGLAVRVIPNNQLALSSAQVFHNNIVDDNGIELVICKANDGYIYIGKTISVQNIDAYTARDQQRPKRDAKIGMLPPKLAQIIINLAVNNAWPANSPRASDEQATTDRPQAIDEKPQVPHPPLTVLDPFCGTGVVLQEALLMGLQPYGTDIDPRMVSYAQTNLAWLQQNPQLPPALEVGDAATYTWQPMADVIASETYLGRPFSTAPKPDELKQVIRDVDAIHKKFLQNVARQTKPGFRLCLAVPAWPVHSTHRANPPANATQKQAPAADSFQRLPVLDSLKEIGYNRTSFVHASEAELIYHRPGQFVGRELVVLTRT